MPNRATSPHEEAAAWVLRLNGGTDEALQAELEAWLARDPANLEAFVNAQASWDLLGEHAAAPELLALRRDALHRARRSRLSWGSGGQAPRRAIAAGIGAVLAGGGAYLALRGQPALRQTYRTAHGEQRIITLADGSRLVLDAVTEVEVAYERRRRGIQLLSGRASFDVTSDPDRPFIVTAQGGSVRALGTMFTVERQTRALVVTLLEGRVAVQDGEGAGRLELRPQDQATLPDGGAAQVRRVDAEEALAWRDGKLIFDDAPLDAAAARINNYGSPAVHVDPSAADLRVNGVFRAGDTEAFVDAVENYFPVEVQRGPDRIAIRLRPPARTP